MAATTVMAQFVVRSMRSRQPAMRAISARWKWARIVMYSLRVVGKGGSKMRGAWPSWIRDMARRFPFSGRYCRGTTCRRRSDYRMDWLKRFFTWWNGATLNTRFHTWRLRRTRGTRRVRQRLLPDGGRRRSIRRWVGSAAGSSMPATARARRRRPAGMAGCITPPIRPPTESKYAPREWEAPYKPNMTGTPLAWRPPGSTLPRANGRRPAAITRHGRQAADERLGLAFIRPCRSATGPSVSLC